MCVCVCVCVRVCLYVCVSMYVYVSTVNRGHNPTLHIHTEDNIASEDGPRFCGYAQTAANCIHLHYRGMLKETKKTINVHRGSG